MQVRRESLSGSFARKVMLGIILTAFADADGREPHDLEPPPGEVRTLVFSPDGRLLGAGCQDGSIKLWDVRSRKHLRTIAAHDDWVENLAFSPDGGSLASSTHLGNECKLWNVRSGKLNADVDASKTWVQSLAFSPDGKRLAAGTVPMGLLLIDGDSGRVLRDVEWKSLIESRGKFVEGVAFSPDGRHVATGDEEGYVRIWDATTGGSVATVQGRHKLGVGSVAFSPDGKLIASGALEGIVRISDVKTGEEKLTLEFSEETGSQVEMLSFSPDDKMLAAGGWGARLRIWRLADGKAVPLPEKYYANAAVSPDWKTLAAEHRGEFIRIRLWDAAQLLAQ